MKDFRVLFDTILVVLLITGTARGDEESEDKKLCTKEHRRAMVSLKKSISACQTSLSTSSPAESTDEQGLGCLVKCVLKHQKALDDDDILTQESFESAMGDRATGKRREYVLERFKKCSEEYGANLKTDDPQCSGYEPFGVCIQSAIDRMCDDDAEVLSKLREEL